MVETINKFHQIERQLIQDLGREPLAGKLLPRWDSRWKKFATFVRFTETVSLETSVGDDDEDSKLEDFIEDVRRSLQRPQPRAPQRLREQG